MQAFEQYWEEKGHLGSSPEQVARLAWDAATEHATGQPDAELYEIDPADFPDDVWMELFNVCELIPRVTAGECSEERHRGEVFQANRADIVEAINNCKAKAISVRSGELGESDEAVNIGEWADELEQAASILEDVLGPCSCNDRAFESTHYSDCALAEVSR